MIDPSNLWLTIHESIGHATELDRALGYEAAYAGTSFATPDQLGSLRYGSPVMTVLGDRTVEHGLATIGFDDEGVAAQQFDIVRDGTLVGYQLNRQMAQANGLGRSNGCAFADSSGHIPLQRMANVSLQPAPDGPSTHELISGVERGIYVVGDRSWSIDMQRFNFQFTGQQFWRIENGRLAGQLRDVAYQATTTDFWGSMEAVGGPDTYVLGGVFTCGKGQPGPGRGGLARLPDRAVPRRERAEHPRRGRPMRTPRRLGARNTSRFRGTQRTHEREPGDRRSRLAAATTDGCVLIVRDHTETNLRFAANSLTTNGQMQSRDVTVIATVDGSDGTRAGVVTRSVVNVDEIESPRPGGRARRARRAAC